MPPLPRSVSWVALVAALVWRQREWFASRIFPFGLPEHVPASERPAASPVDPSNQSLREVGRLAKIRERRVEGRAPLLQGPETVLFDTRTNSNENNEEGVSKMYVLTDEAKLVSLTDLRPSAEASAAEGCTVLTADATEVADLGTGRPLGGKFDAHGNVYVADTLLGLVKVTLKKEGEKNNKTTVELVASSVKLPDGTWSPIRYANDVAIGPKTGHVYFTDSTDVIPDRVGTPSSLKWDTMYGSKTDLMRGKKTGRLLRYDPETGNVDVLATGIWFANGVAVADEDETAVFVAETFALRTLRHDLVTGETTVVADELPGYPDGADCVPSTSKCYVSMPSSLPKIIDLMNSLPNRADLLPRALMMALPRKLAPAVTRYGGVAETDLSKRIVDESGNVRYETRILQDPNGEDIAMLTGVTEHKGKLYLGSLTNDYIGVYDLN